MLYTGTDMFHLNLSVSINLGGATTDPAGLAATAARTSPIDRATGEIEYVAGGLRTPHGMGWGRTVRSS